MKKWICLFIYILGIISYGIFFICTKTSQRYLFLIIVGYFEFNAIELIGYIKETKRKEKVKKYSKKSIVGKNLEKLSY